SPALLAWLAVFGLANGLYLPLVEEPRLARRFGDHWRDYAAHVPRWLPGTGGGSSDPDDRL
ncbi:MAG: isoprenylcysteine carboxylmethyltransferase family protein, partial [Alphaproteobacteria bacterium]